MSKLWKKSATKLHPLIEKYTVGEDYLLDAVLMPYDIQASAAHAKGLEKIGIFNKDELAKVLSRLKQLDKDFKGGKVKISIEDEDCHTVIENYLTKKYKTLGQKIHTGRSRNDQVLTAMRLYMKDQLGSLENKGKKLAIELLEFAKKHQKVAMPGYSHTQQAMLSSVGHYFCAYTESLIDDLSFLGHAYTHIDKNPLGSAAGFGVPLLLPRELTTKAMGFKEVQINSLYCQNSRGKFESIYMEALSQIMLTLSRFANDLILFTSQEFNFFKIKDNLVTGSSIMPQKRNLDGLEILRANASVIISNHLLIQNICKSLISGYHRDLQLMKKALIESTDIVKDSIEIAMLYVNGITPNETIIAEKISKEIFAADIATEMAKKEKIPFRSAYQQAMKEVKKYKVDLQANLSSKKSLGAPGNLDINHYSNLLIDNSRRKQTTTKASRRT